MSILTRYQRNYLGFVLLGTLNNVIYVVIVSAAQRLAETFDASSSFGDITWASNVTGLLCRVLAVFLSTRLSFAKRVSLTLSFLLSGVLVIGFSPQTGSFALCVVGVVLVGTGTTFGESVMLGYAKLWKSEPEIVGGWSAGTGVAGVLGAAVYIAVADVDISVVFFSNVPLVVVYGAVYWLVMVRPARKMVRARRGEMVAGCGDAQTDSFLLHDPTRNGGQRGYAQGNGGDGRYRNNDDNNDNNNNNNNNNGDDGNNNNISSSNNNENGFENNTIRGQIQGEAIADVVAVGVRAQGDDCSGGEDAGKSKNSRKRNGTGEKDKKAAAKFGAADGGMSLESPLLRGSEAHRSINGYDSCSNSNSIADSGSDSGDDSGDDEPDDATYREGLARLWRVTKECLFLSINMGLVYYFEYMISQGCANNAQRPGSLDSKNWFMRNAYVVLQFCYQLGVLLSRSSLRFFRVRRVGVITILQAANLALWLCQDRWHFMPLAVQFPAMIWVGLMGGLSYVSIFYIILEGGIFEKKDREIAVNVSATFMNTGIILAGVTTVVLDHTLFKNNHE